MSRKLTFDRWLFGVVILIVVFGVVMIYSASAIIATQRFGAPPFYFMTRQLLWLLAGGLAGFLLMQVDAKLLQDRRVIGAMMVVVLGALLLALFQPAINGKHRWIVLAHMQMQPSEFAKPVIILFLAAFLAKREDRIDELSTTLLPIACVIALFGGLIVLEDFGTAATLVAVAAAMVFVAGISWKRILLFSILVVPAVITLAFGAAYRRDRLFSFLNPEADPLGKGFQAMQSLIALGTGGLRGLGIGNGRQKLFFLPEPHTDFIFSIIGEELGFIGAVLVIGAFGIVAWRGFRIARYSQERFAFYAAVGCTLVICGQALFNISVALCMFPTKGLPLPLVSYGGSSLVASLISVGILLNLSQQSS